MPRVIQKEVVVLASPREVWDAWTTVPGVSSFLAPRANLELTIGGRYEMYFDLDAPPGSQGSEGCKVLSYLPQRMLSFDWNAPPQFPNVRKERTWIVVLLEVLGVRRVKVKLTHLGWKEGEEWDEVFRYFTRAWGTVLARLEHRFSTAPIDWSNPYRPPSATPSQ